MRLAHVTDFHLGLKGVSASGEPLDPLHVARAVAEDLAAISDALDLVVVSGDLTDRAEPRAFAEFEALFREIALPIFAIPGNHDGPRGFHAYSEASPVFAEWNLTNRVIEVEGVRFLGLDTCIERVTQGRLDEAGLALFETEVARDDGNRLVVVMHHPPLLLGLDQFDGFCRLEGRERFLDIANAAQEEVITLAGHVHRPYTAREGRIACFVAGSMIAPHDSALPFGDLPIRPTTFQDFYDIHDIAPGGRHVVTPQRVRALAP
ncbi:metallophosphoesterase family protein [Ovoidimarina sediminis]|uniref:metallophosphoesterase family protein n=1 Tax=Ovoidimarina sediminis TaxID=3079856 RepID=UPI002909361B|nr:metallophosphoesterase [Rhodophyticola sp. MJ-SS7]MDU8944160.1 metallophosphoesterase [Rhodophyticola sp. MJ-SS7]